MKKKQSNVSLMLLFALFVQISFAQEINVSGVVSDGSGLPLPGVNVFVKETPNGVQTDFDGRYSIKVNKGQILVFSFLGMQSEEKAVVSNKLDLSMKDDAVELEGVVVTALGISREKKSLGYSSQQLDAKEVNSIPTNNFLNNLSGKVAGLEVRANSNFGGSTNIVLRGTKSLTGNNQALIVVDGVPISNVNTNKDDTKNGRGGFDFGNSASDIDQNNIESITVLKGAAATALYGSQAANGAIMITTKKGKIGNGLGITFSSTVSIGEFDKNTFAKYQDQYGIGYTGNSFSGKDAAGNPVVLMTEDASYGSKFDPNLNVRQWYSYAPGNANFGQATPWVAAKNNPSSFFQTAYNTVNNINLNGADERNTYNFSYTNNHETGILPNSQLNRNILSGNFSRKLFDKLTSTTFVSFTNQNTIGRNRTGYSDNLIGGFRQWWATSTDILELKNEYFRNKENVTWNMNNPEKGDFSPAYWNNPYWDRYENYSQDRRTRLITGTNLSYDITEDFNILGRVTIDKSNDRQELRKKEGSHAEVFGVVPNSSATSGYSLYTRDFLQQTYDFIATYNYQISEKIGSKFLGGITYITSKTETFFGSTTGGLVLPDFYSLSNSRVFVAPEEDDISYQKRGIFGQASFDYERFFFLEGSLRRDKSTALPKNNNAYNYFSVGNSFIASHFIEADWLSNLKIRLNYAEVGNDPAPGLLGYKENNGIVDGNFMYSNSETNVNFENLKPEKLKSWEFGIEATAFKNRLNLDLSLYQSNTVNQIFKVPQSTATGFVNSQINAGELQNRGIEVSSQIIPIRTTDFQWSATINWSKNYNELISLDRGRSNLQLALFQHGVTLNATVGEAYGSLRGTDFEYDNNGNKIVGEDGLYKKTNDQIIGNIQPDWIGGILNRFTYKDISFSFLIDVKKGGSVFSLDQAYGQATGLYPETVGNNSLGNPVRNTIAEGGGIIFPGVKQVGVDSNGNPIYANNDILVDASKSGAFGYESMPNSAFIYDASFVKLREVALSYNVPSDYLEKFKLKNLSLSLLGNNLWIIHKNLPYADPEAGVSSGNIQGVQSGVLPTTRIYSFNIKASF